MTQPVPTDRSEDWDPPAGPAVPVPAAQPALVVQPPASGGVRTGASSRRPGRIGIVVGALVLLVVGLGLGDWAARNIEMSRLLGAVEQSESAMGVSQDATRTAIQEFLRANGTKELGREVPAKLEAEFRQIADVARDRVSAAGEQVASVSFLPWHEELIDAQAAYLAHNRAWVEHLAASSADGAELLEPDDAINSTWKQAEVAMRASVPLIPFPGIEGRVDEIFVDDTPDGGDGGAGVAVSWSGPGVSPAAG